MPLARDFAQVIQNIIAKQNNAKGAYATQLITPPKVVAPIAATSDPIATYFT
jgi:hypothetical protein